MTCKIDTKVHKFIQKHRLIEQGDEIVVGVSGGADSVMLMHFLYRHQKMYQINLKIAHIHHGIREEADEDALYVEQLAKAYNVPFYRADYNIRELSKNLKISEEAAGRKKRYDFFISLTNEYGKIATAHHMNDQAETILMRMFRGSDIKGLGGILPQRGQIIRPLLGITREEVEIYCKTWGLDYKEDITNMQTIYTRNKMRLECLPYIKEAFNPNIIKTLDRQGQMYQELHEFITRQTEKAYNECVIHEKDSICIEIEALKQKDIYIQRCIIVSAIETLLGHSNNITSTHIQSIIELLECQSGKEVHLPYELVAKKIYHTCRISHLKENESKEFNYHLALGENYIQEIGCYVILKEVTRKTFEQSKENMYTKYIDYDRIKDNLRLRTMQVSDRIQVSVGSKKIKKFFSDEKIPGVQRKQMPLIVDGHEVVWVIGLRLSSHYYITEHTKRILQVTIISEHKLQEGLC